MICSDNLPEDALTTFRSFLMRLTFQGVSHKAFNFNSTQSIFLGFFFTILFTYFYVIAKIPLLTLNTNRRLLRTVS